MASGAGYFRHGEIVAIFPVRGWLYKIAARIWSRTGLRFANGPRHL